MLESWNDGTAKSAIVDFVARVTREGGKDFVPPAARIAVFDSDGTLWAEQPMQAQVFFLFDRLKQLAAKDATLEHGREHGTRLEEGVRRAVGRSRCRP